jgi:hypothetical protein
VASERGRSSIGEVGSGDGAPSTTVDTAEELNDGLDLGVIERILGRVGVDTAW